MPLVRNGAWTATAAQGLVVSKTFHYFVLYFLLEVVLSVLVS